MGIFTITPEVKLSGGWRFNDRTINFNGDPTLAWHQNWLLLGGVVQPSHAFRLNVNYDIMHSKSANSDTTSNTYTREAPDSDQSPAAAHDGHPGQVDQLRCHRQRLLGQE